MEISRAEKPKPGRNGAQQREMKRNRQKYRNGEWNLTNRVKRANVYSELERNSENWDENRKRVGGE